jgi:hypothetical protein
MKRALSAVIASALALCAHPALALDATLAPVSAPVFVLGKQVRFDHLETASGQPVVAASDSGFQAMLAAIGARMTWQPGTRFLAVTRADGKIVTLTVGSNAMSVDGATTALTLAPFYRGSALFVPLLPVTDALGLASRTYRGGYIFVPRIESVTRKIGQVRTIVQIGAAIPVAWRSSFDSRLHMLTVSLPGFGVDPSVVALGGREATQAVVNQTGPPGYPTAIVSITVKPGVKFAAHREPNGVMLDVILARDEAALRLYERPTPQPVSAIAPTNPATPMAVPTAQPPGTARPRPGAGARHPRVPTGRRARRRGMRPPRRRGTRPAASR